MDKVHVDSHWFYDSSMRGFYYIPSGYYEVGKEIDLHDKKLLTAVEVRSLIPVLFREGFIDYKVSVESRSDDIKIINRLIDTIQQK